MIKLNSTLTKHTLTLALISLTSIGAAYAHGGGGGGGVGAHGLAGGAIGGGAAGSAFGGGAGRAGDGLTTATPVAGRGAGIPGGAYARAARSGWGNYGWGWGGSLIAPFFDT